MRRPIPSLDHSDFFPRISPACGASPPPVSALPAEPACGRRLGLLTGRLLAAGLQGGGDGGQVAEQHRHQLAGVPGDVRLQVLGELAQREQGRVPDGAALVPDPLTDVLQPAGQVLGAHPLRAALGRHGQRQEGRLAPVLVITGQ